MQLTMFVKHCKKKFRKNYFFAMFYEHEKKLMFFAAVFFGGGGGGTFLWSVQHIFLQIQAYLTTRSNFRACSREEIFFYQPSKFKKVIFQKEGGFYLTKSKKKLLQFCSYNDDFYSKGAHINTMHFSSIKILIFLFFVSLSAKNDEKTAVKKRCFSLVHSGQTNFQYIVHLYIMNNLANFQPDRFINNGATAS